MEVGGWMIWGLDSPKEQCYLDPSHVKFTVGFVLLQESNTIALLMGGGPKAVMQATGSGCKYR